MASTATDLSNPTVHTHCPPHDHPIPNLTTHKKKKTKKVFKDVIATQPSSLAASSSSSSSMAISSTQRTTRVPLKRRNMKVASASLRRGGCVVDAAVVEAIAFPLGMSFAAVVAQVLEKKYVAGERISVDHLSGICTSAVRESLANVFGDKFDSFVRNFDKSFGSTLKTLRLVNDSSTDRGSEYLSQQNAESFASDILLKRVGCNDCSCGNSEIDGPPMSNQNLVHISDEMEDATSTNCLNQQLLLYHERDHLACVSSPSGAAIKQLSTIEKSVMEQARSNDLKALEISLTMKKLKLKEEDLALSYDSNHLERSKLAMGVSKASFKAEQFKTRLEDTRHAELLKKCLDCLVAGLFIMSGLLLYGAYIYSYKRITDATASCSPSPEESMSWWIPKPVSTFNSGLHTLRCQVQVISRMLFGILMILAVAYLLLQRSTTSQQAMPVTFILLLLGGACGFAGKFCVDTLGGSGIQWLLYWEILCSLHFLSMICKSTLFQLLYGPITISQLTKQRKAMCPYWIRQSLFYTFLLLILPLCCGLLPFASPREWRDHFVQVASDLLTANDD